MADPASETIIDALVEKLEELEDLHVYREDDKTGDQAIRPSCVVAKVREPWQRADDGRTFNVDLDVTATVRLWRDEAEHSDRAIALYAGRLKAKVATLGQADSSTMPCPTYIDEIERDEDDPSQSFRIAVSFRYVVNALTSELDQVL